MEYKKAELHMSTKMKFKVLVVEWKQSSQREIPYIYVCGGKPSSPSSQQLQKFQQVHYSFWDKGGALKKSSQAS